LTHRLIGRPVKNDMAVGYARLCGQYAAASALLSGGLGIGDFTPAALADLERLELASRVSIEPDGNPDPNAMAPIAATVRLRDGTEFCRTLETVYGNPANPMSREAHLAKFRTNARAAARPLSENHIEELIAMVDNLDSQATVTPLLDLAFGATS